MTEQQMPEKPHVESPVGFVVEPTISYSIKDILSRMESKLDRLADSLASKADHTDVVRLWETIRAQDDRLKTVEDVIKNQGQKKQDAKAWKQWAIPTILSLLGTVALVISVFHL